jgi:hypothetical protein
VRPAQSDLMMLVVGWWESDMTAKHTQKIRAMDSGVLLTAYNGLRRIINQMNLKADGYIVTCEK